MGLGYQGVCDHWAQFTKTFRPSVFLSVLQNSCHKSTMNGRNNNVTSEKFIEGLYFSWVQFTIVADMDLSHPQMYVCVCVWLCVCLCVCEFESVCVFVCV